MGVRVVLRDGRVDYDDAARFTITDDGTLVLLGSDQATEVARFEVGNWLNAELLDLPH